MIKYLNEVNRYLPFNKNRFFKERRLQGIKAVFNWNQIILVCSF